MFLLFSNPPCDIHSYDKASVILRICDTGRLSWNYYYTWDQLQALTTSSGFQFNISFCDEIIMKELRREIIEERARHGNLILYK